ncbi:hypothetical protein [Candidatus Nitrospira salsa]
MNTRQLISTGTGPVSRPTPSRQVGLRQTSIISGLLFLTLGIISPVWAGKGQKTYTTPLHLTGLSIHVGPGGLHPGIGGHRHRFRGPQGHLRRHFGHRHYFGPSPFAYRYYERHTYRPRYFGGHPNHRGHFKGGRLHRRHRH